jgi:hypothetical protein
MFEVVINPISYFICEKQGYSGNQFYRQVTAIERPNRAKCAPERGMNGYRNSICGNDKAAHDYWHQNDAQDEELYVGMK